MTMPRPQAWVQIALDLTPPVLDLFVPERAIPPVELEVLLSSTAPLMAVTATFTDSLSVEHSLGAWVEDEFTAAMSLPTVSLSAGSGVLSVAVVDQAGNPGYISRSVRIDRPSAFDLASGTGSAFEVTTSVLDVYDLFSYVEVGP